jgi:hypothetical protein
MESQYKQNLKFENVWKKDVPEIQQQVVAIWKRFSKLSESSIDDRKTQIVFVVKNKFGMVVGISSASKIYVKQLRNFFYIYRCLITPDYRIPGLDAKLTVLTRDLLESVHELDGTERAIGVMTLVQNPKLKERNLAIWPASGFVYIGNSKEGKHIRVYYFKGAKITP